MTDFHRPHILIVSDDLDLSQFLQDGLVMAGFWTSTVASALQTLELFRLRTFDLMLIDALLEGLGADEVVQRLRAPIEPGGPIRTDIPIVLIAGSSDEVNADRVSAMGADSVVYAPIEIKALAVELFGRIRSWRAQHPDRPWADKLAQSKPQ
jgi:two-component system, OmpR family, response regulator